MFEFAYSLDGNNAVPVVDLALDTAANYKTAGTNGVTKGDLVFLNAGLLRRTNDAVTPKASGVLEGTEFVGLVAQGQPYAATNASLTASAIGAQFPNGVGKVRRDISAVYRVALVTGQTATNANIGASYGIAVDAAGNQVVDLTEATNLLVKVEGISKDGKKVFVTILPSVFI